MLQPIVPSQDLSRVHALGPDALVFLNVNVGKITVSDQHIGIVPTLFVKLVLGELYHAYSLWSLATIHDFTWY